ncbi:MAG: hypothetical protein WBQ86_19800 [Candidatus Binatus sp.]
MKEAGTVRESTFHCEQIAKSGLIAREFLEKEQTERIGCFGLSNVGAPLESRWT